MSCLSWLVVIAALLAVTQALLKEDKNVAYFFTHVACRSDAWAMKYPNLLQCDTAHPFMLFTKEQCQRGCKDRGADVFTFAQGSDWPFTHADMVELDKEKTKLRGEAFEPWRTSITVGTNPEKLPHFWVKHTDTVESYRVSIGETANGIKVVDDEKPANWKKAALVEWENNKRVLCLCQVNEASINLQRSDKNDDDPSNNKLNQDKKELLDEEKRANENLKNDQKSKQMAIIIALITTGVMLVVGLSVVLIVLKATSEQAGRAPMSVYGQAASRM